MAWLICPYHSHSYETSPIPNALSTADRVLDTFDFMFELPSGWLDYMQNYEHGMNARQEHGQTKEIVNDKDKFKVDLDVKGFKPNELTVTCVKDRFIMVHGKHKEWENKENEKGYVTREFKRSYVIPKGVDAKKLKMNLTKDGVLTLEAPKYQQVTASERVIPIECGQVQENEKK